MAVLSLNSSVFKKNGGDETYGKHYKQLYQNSNPSALNPQMVSKIYYSINTKRDGRGKKHMT